MTAQTMFEAEQKVSLGDRLEGTALDPAKGRKREFRLILALTVMVLVPFYTVAAVVNLVRPSKASRRSIVQEALATARSALPFAYRH